jgi:hypothetical protein
MGLGHVPGRGAVPFVRTEGVIDLRCARAWKNASASVMSSLRRTGSVGDCQYEV